MPFKDLEHRRKYRREWYSKNKESEKAHVQRRKTKIKKWFREYKVKLNCTICSENHPATIDFHHDKSNKEIGISKMIAEGYSIQKILSEIKKCKVLCANCHRKIHYKKRSNKF